MKNRLSLILLLLVAGVCNGQIITTVAGNGLTGNSGDGGSAVSANIDFILSGVFNRLGDYYFSSSSGYCNIRKITPSGIISTVAGGSCGFYGDGGVATASKLNSPQGITIDTFGNLFIADNVNNRIRKIDIITGTITTIAGIGSAGFGGDGGPATACILSDPLDVCFDKFGNLYIADANNNRVRKINKSGIISTFAGTGVAGVGGDGGLATMAKIHPWAVCSDMSGAIYIADNGIGESRVCKVATSGIISTVAGNPVNYIYNGDGIPATDAYLSASKIAMDIFGNLYISDVANSRIRRVDANGIIHTEAGTGIPGYNMDNVVATSSQINFPGGIALDSCGDLYIADSRNYRIRKVTYPKCHYLETENIPKASQQLSINPTPTNDLLHINNLQTPASYKLLNMPGAVLQQGTLKAGDNSISIEALPVGMYMLEVINAAVGLREVRKVVKQ